MRDKQYSLQTNLFYGRQTPEDGVIVGYGALIERLKLSIPMPERLSLIAQKTKKYQTDVWSVYSPSYQPEETLYKQLVFAIKYEGIHLLFFKALFKKISEKELLEVLHMEPMGQYSRKIWFLYEWLMQKQIEVKVDLKKRKYIPLIDENLQYAIEANEVARQKIANNLPGTPEFCPLIRKTEKLEGYIKAKLSEQKNEYLASFQTSILQRASSFLLLKDSKASFSIEQENPGTNRAMRWGKAIGQAGSQTLRIEELERLQQIIIENARFVKLGLRKEGGFVGEHDRLTGEPIPDHISAKEDDLLPLLNGLVNANQLMQDKGFDAVLAAAAIAFGMVFIHPFQDGNGRLHRYIIHHILAKKRFTNQGVIFPISASILDHIEDYRQVLESYSHPLLDLIEWETTSDHNVKVLNETIDFYRYFDATKQAEFLYDCVSDTLNRIIPEEVNYLLKYDEFKVFIDENFEMPDKLLATLVRFLEQNEGLLSKRALNKEFSALTKNEVKAIQEQYSNIFLDA